MSIRDIVRRERWEMNRCAHEAELMLAGEMYRPDIRDEGSAWEMIVDSYTNEVIAEGWQRLNQQLAR